MQLKGLAQRGLIAAAAVCMSIYTSLEHIHRWILFIYISVNYERRNFLWEYHVMRASHAVMRVAYRGNRNKLGYFRKIAWYGTRA